MNFKFPRKMREKREIKLIVIIIGVSKFDINYNFIERRDFLAIVYVSCT